MKTLGKAYQAGVPVIMREKTTHVQCPFCKQYMVEKGVRNDYMWEWEYHCLVPKCGYTWETQ